METKLLDYTAYGITTYALAYALYLLVKAASQRGVSYPITPYDQKNLVLRRR